MSLRRVQDLEKDAKYHSCDMCCRPLPNLPDEQAIGFYLGRGLCLKLPKQKAPKGVIEMLELCETCHAALLSCFDGVATEQQQIRLPELRAEELALLETFWVDKELPPERYKTIASLKKSIVRLEKILSLVPAPAEKKKPTKAKDAPGQLRLPFDEDVEPPDDAVTDAPIKTAAKRPAATTTAEEIDKKRTRGPNKKPRNTVALQAYKLRVKRLKGRIYPEKFALSDIPLVEIPAHGDLPAFYASAGKISQITWFMLTQSLPWDYGQEPDNRGYASKSQPATGLAHAPCNKVCEKLTRRAHAEGWFNKNMQIRLPSEREYAAIEEHEGMVLSGTGHLYQELCCDRYRDPQHTEDLAKGKDHGVCSKHYLARTGDATRPGQVLRKGVLPKSHSPYNTFRIVIAPIT